MSLNWFNDFKTDILQYEEGSRRNKVIVICSHRTIEEEKCLSKILRDTMLDVQFTFQNCKRGKDALNINREMTINSSHSYTSIIFSQCDDPTCFPCSYAAEEFKEYLKEHSIIYKEPGHQFPVRNVFFYRNKLVFSRVKTSGSGWKAFIRDNVAKGKIINEKTTKILVLSGGHGDLDGNSAMNDRGCEEIQFLREDYGHKEELNGKDETRHIRIEIVDLRKSSIGRLSSKIKRGRYTFVILAFCFSFHSKLKRALNREGIKYSLTCVDQCSKCNAN